MRHERNWWRNKRIKEVTLCGYLYFFFGARWISVTWKLLLTYKIHKNFTFSSIKYFMALFVCRPMMPYRYVKVWWNYSDIINLIEVSLNCLLSAFGISHLHLRIISPTTTTTITKMNVKTISSSSIFLMCLHPFVYSFALLLLPLIYKI